MFCSHQLLTLFLSVFCASQDAHSASAASRILQRCPSARAQPFSSLHHTRALFSLVSVLKHSLHCSWLPPNPGRCCSFGACFSPASSSSSVSGLLLSLARVAAPCLFFFCRSQSLHALHDTLQSEPHDDFFPPHFVHPLRSRARSPSASSSSFPSARERRLFSHGFVPANPRSRVQHRSAQRILYTFSVCVWCFT